MIEITRLEKRFGRFAALHELSLSLAPGAVAGVIGPNGSGKSTLIKCILGLVQPTSGSILIDGMVINGDAEYRRKIGYMPQLARFPQGLKVKEAIQLIKSLRDEPAERETELIELFDLGKELNKRVGTLSGGNRQKLSLVISCMYDPDILILDEPTAGLDPVSASKLKEFLMTLKARKKTVIMTSHIISDIEQLADNLALLLEGRLRFHGSIKDLKHLTGQPLLERAIVEVLRGVAA